MTVSTVFRINIHLHKKLWKTTGPLAHSLMAQSLGTFAILL